MPRNIDDWSTLGAAMHRATAHPVPAWVHPATADLLRAGLAALKRDALDATDGETTTQAPRTLGVGRTAYMEATAPGGWLALNRPNAAPAEVFAAADARAEEKRVRPPRRR